MTRAMARGALDGEFRLGHFAHQAGALGVAGVDGLAAEHHLHGQGLAHGAQQALGAAGARHDAEVDFRLAEAGVLAGDEDVGVHGQLAAAAQGETVDCGYQGFGEAGDALPVGLARVVEDADQVALGHR